MFKKVLVLSLLVSGFVNAQKKTLGFVEYREVEQTTIDSLSHNDPKFKEINEEYQFKKLTQYQINKLIEDMDVWRSWVYWKSEMNNNFYKLYKQKPLPSYNTRVRYSTYKSASGNTIRTRSEYNSDTGQYKSTTTMNGKHYSTFTTRY